MEIAGEAGIVGVTEISLYQLITAMRADVVEGSNVVPGLAVTDDHKRFAAQVSTKIIADLGQIMHQTGKPPGLGPEIFPFKVRFILGIVTPGVDALGAVVDIGGLGRMAAGSRIGISDITSLVIVFHGRPQS